MSESIQCCNVSCDQELNQDYWNTQYLSRSTGWDLGQVSPPLKAYIDRQDNKDLKILIPGCGNAYEAAYLLEQGFRDVTVLDIAPEPVRRLQDRFRDYPQIRVVQQDFFEHRGQYDLILEQTFFCALPPHRRVDYVYQMHRLLRPGGYLVGLLFNRSFEQGPPFGGDRKEYEHLFRESFITKEMDIAGNSVKPRSGTELFIVLSPDKNLVLQRYTLSGMTCSRCALKVEERLRLIPFLRHSLINTAYNTLLLVSEQPVATSVVRAAVLLEPHYSIVES